MDKRILQRPLRKLALQNGNLWTEAYAMGRALLLRIADIRRYRAESSVVFSGVGLFSVLFVASCELMYRYFDVNSAFCPDSRKLARFAVNKTYL